MSRETENVLLLLVGLGIALTAFSGTFLRYVKPALHPWLLASAALLVTLAIVSIAQDIRTGGRPGDHGGHHHRAGTVWLLAVPVALLLFVVPPAIGPQTARPAAAQTSRDDLDRDFPPLPDEPAPELSLPEILIRIAHDSAGTLRNRTLTVTGFTVRDGAHTDLARVVIICCAADAQLARIRLVGGAVPALGRLPEGSWVRVTGRAAAISDDPGAGSTPEFDAATVQRIAQPPNTYS